MATISRLNLRKALSESYGDYLSFTASANGNAAKTSIIADILKNSPSGTDDGGFEDLYFLSISGANNGEARQCSRYVPDASDGATVIVQSTFSSQVASGDSFEMHRYDPALKHTALTIALSELFPYLYVPLRDESLVIDNLLSNSDFETYSAGFTGWTEVNSPTVTQESSRVFHGTYAAKLVAPAGSVGQLTQSPTINIDEVTGKTATFKSRVWTNGASRARLRLDWDGTNISNGSYHDGNSEWMLLSVSGAVPTSATQVKAICEVAASQTGYFDGAWLAIDPVYKYTVPASLIRGPFQVLQQYAENNVNGPYFALRNGGGPTQGRVLRLTGMGALTLPATDSATTEIGEPQLRLVIAYAKKVLWELLLGRSATLNRQSLVENAQLAKQEVERISKQAGIRMAAMSATRGENAWHIEEDSGGRYLVFDVSRS